MEKIKLNSLHQHPENPREGWTDERLDKLAKSIEKFPKAMTVRGLLIDDEGLIWGGNQRHEALTKTGVKKIPKSWTQSVAHLTLEERKQLMILDNADWGQWANDVFDTEYWEGVDFDEWKGGEWEGEDTDIDYSDKNKEIDVDDFDDNMKLVLNFTSEEYEFVKASLSKIAQTPEQAVWKLLTT